MLSYEAFVKRILELVDIELQTPVNPYDSLYDDVGLDSLQAFQLIIFIEALAETTPMDDVPQLYTVQDAFDYYVSLCNERV